MSPPLQLPPIPSFNKENARNSFVGDRRTKHVAEIGRKPSSAIATKKSLTDSSPRGREGDVGSSEYSKRPEATTRSSNSGQKRTRNNRATHEKMILQPRPSPQRKRVASSSTQSSIRPVPSAPVKEESISSSVLRSDETVDALFCLAGSSGAESEEHRALCFEIAYGAKAGDCRAWRRALRVASESVLGATGATSAGDAEVHATPDAARVDDLLRLHRRATTILNLNSDEDGGDDETKSVYFDIMMSHARTYAVCGKKEDARRTYRQIQNRRLGEVDATLYLAMADLERRGGDSDAAREALQLGIEKKARPLQALLEGISELKSVAKTSTGIVIPPLPTSTTGALKRNSAPAAAPPRHDRSTSANPNPHRRQVDSVKDAESRRDKMNSSIPAISSMRKINGAPARVVVHATDGSSTLARNAREVTRDGKGVEQKAPPYADDDDDDEPELHISLKTTKIKMSVDDERPHGEDGHPAQNTKARHGVTAPSLNASTGDEDDSLSVVFNKNASSTTSSKNVEAAHDEDATVALDDQKAISISADKSSILSSAAGAPPTEGEDVEIAKKEPTPTKSVSLAASSRTSTKALSSSALKFKSLSSIRTQKRLRGGAVRVNPDANVGSKSDDDVSNTNEHACNDSPSEDSSCKKAKTDDSISIQLSPVKKLTKMDLSYMLNWNPSEHPRQSKAEASVHKHAEPSLGKIDEGTHEGLSAHGDTKTGTMNTHGNTANMHTGSTNSSGRSHRTTQTSADASTHVVAHDSTEHKGPRAGHLHHRTPSPDSNGHEIGIATSSRRLSTASGNTASSHNLSPLEALMPQLNHDFLPLVKEDNILRVNNMPYAKLGVIGKGGSCKVYRALSKDCAVVAIKKVKLGGKDRKAIDGYANEIALLRRLRGNPAIIKLHDSEVDLGRKAIFLVMELGEIDLNYVLQQQVKQAEQQHTQSSSHERPSLNMNFIRLTWQQMLSAVHCIHEERIIHGDLKPANFLFVRGCLKLIDFGIAKAIQTDDTTNIYRDSQIGTLNYMSPEAILDTGSGRGAARMKLGRASDIWSLGCILYQMVYGKTPFAELHMIQKLQAIVNPDHEIKYPVADEAAIDAMKLCLRRKSEQRPPIVGANGLLTNHRFLNSKLWSSLSGSR